MDKEVYKFLRKKFKVGVYDVIWKLLLKVVDRVYLKKLKVEVLKCVFLFIVLK